MQKFRHLARQLEREISKSSTVSTTAIATSIRRKNSLSLSNSAPPCTGVACHCLVRVFFDFLPSPPFPYIFPLVMACKPSDIFVQHCQVSAPQSPSVSLLAPKFHLMMTAHSPSSPTQSATWACSMVCPFRFCTSTKPLLSSIHPQSLWSATRCGDSLCVRRPIPLHQQNLI